MDILSTNNDPYSCALPELARVIHTHLELKVDFDQKVLEGKAILNIVKKYENCEKGTIFLDSCNLDIIKVTDSNTGLPLCYDIGLNCSCGNIFKIELLGKNVLHKIEIEYRTSEHSHALIWLTPEQTADGKHPFLLSNTKYTYARAMFPCQDTPSVKTTYSAKISTPKDFRVIMSAKLRNIIHTQDQVMYEFFQRSLTPAYGVVIAVGSLEAARNGPRINVYAESKFIDESRTTFDENFERMLEIADELYGLSLDKQNICVLPPTISPKYFTIQCRNMIFVSPSLLRGDISLISSLAQQIAHLWTEHFVVNYDHMWLSKSIGMFIYKKFINRMPINEKIKEFLLMKMDRKLVKRIEGYKDIDILQNLIPRLGNISPNYLMERVPYEVGCMLLEKLQHELGGPLIFDRYLKLYLYTFLHRSINTQDWIRHLTEYCTTFCPTNEMVTSFDWSIYFFYTEPLIPNISITALETACFNLAEEWTRCDDNAKNIPRKFIEVTSYSDIEKIELLKYLYDSSVGLTVIKINLMSNFYESHESHTYEIRFRWIRLCIKNRWEPIIDTALNFAIHFCTPKYACSIFEDLYNWKEIRLITIEAYRRNEKKFVHETQEKINSILLN
ncbi:leukotriene A-4 hydrolase-like isoform X1 [Temnothorax curvispinosus]|uniref:Leukotriene A-4 hydrolase-like isoform X1 n=1 Tax=Temnothorax curvispinosus TaxID=300111 RepID=A0A6J1QCV2_9HYME|nr:leukotriene A-4 hydrolase-like isoform X1 [Temnothorax curvispinosus]XP_024880129.1 leukotriene A-4 hydrolase-like isoform X1 [Temnothorax curvispinosus]